MPQGCSPSGQPSNPGVQSSLKHGGGLGVSLAAVSLGVSLEQGEGSLRLGLSKRLFDKTVMAVEGT